MPHQMRGATCATLILLASSAVATDTLSYPTPPNPFATPKPPPGDAPLPHPPSLDELRPSLPPGAAPKAKAKRLRFRPRWQSAVCLAGLSALCVQTRPGEPALLTAIDEYHQEAGSLIDSSLRGMETGFREMGVGSIAVHSELVWLGMLGMWLPLVPITKDAIAHWLPVASAHQLIVSALTVGYLLRKLLPRSLAEALFSVSFSNIARLRLWTPLTAAFSPMGLVHWLHAVVVLLAVMPALGGSFSRNEQLLLYAGAGAASSLACVIMQLLFRRRAQPRSTVSGAVMGVLLMRAAIAPDELVSVGSWAMPVLRVALMHAALDVGSNALPNSVGVDKLFSWVGAAVAVAATRPQLRDLVQEGGWEGVLDYIRSAL